MAYSHMPYVENKMAATLKVHKCHVKKVCSRLFVSLYEPYQSFLSEQQCRYKALLKYQTGKSLNLEYIRLA